MPPLGLLMLASSLKTAGFCTDLIDCVAEAPTTELAQPNGLVAVGMQVDDATARILVKNPSVVCLSVLYSCDVDVALALGSALRSAGFTGPIVVGGLHASIYPADFLGAPPHTGALPIFDFVIRGEGEFRLPALLADLVLGLYDERADGLCGFGELGRFENAQIEQIEDLDSLPLPEYSAIDLERYFSLNLPFSPVPRGSRVAQILTSRGCPIGCTFCASTNFNRRHRVRSVKSVVDEIRYLKDRYGVDEIQIADDNLTLQPKRAIELIEALRTLNVWWCTPNGIMVNTLDNELIDAMSVSGLYQVTLSFDGGTPSTLRIRHRKPVNLLHGVEAAHRFVNHGVLVHATLVIGMPGETREDIQSAFEFFLSLPIQSAAVFFAQPLPGSELYERLVDAGQIDHKLSRAVDTSRPVPGVSDIPPEELLGLADVFLRRLSRQAENRYPDLCRIKYERHRHRLSRWIVGMAPNQNFRHVVHHDSGNVEP